MPWAARACLLLLLLAVWVHDWRRRRVPNRLVLAGLLAGAAALLPGVHQPLGVGPWQALAGMLVGFFCLLPFYPLGWMGAGDVKFAGVLGLWFGVQPLLPIWCLASLLAALHALAWVALRRHPLPPLLQRALEGQRGPADTPGADQAPRRCIPYAAYLAMAAMAVMVTR
ncbi:A24 family peptidase [Xylophilus sp. ASV27]|uniref:A24 family peptidase n=1 Tax=Xylophilus sp. ASV27 TaxID=2795129 RepID=UPI0018EAA815|nr:A24 family peptidase [Xylophilus sp. ASV27]